MQKKRPGRKKKPRIVFIKKWEKLTNKEKLFIENYVNNGYNASKAARDAGYSEKTAKDIGKENLQKPHLKQWIDYKIDKKIQEIKALGLEALQLTRKIANNDITDILKEDTVITDNGKQKVITLKSLDEIDGRMIKSAELKADGTFKVVLRDSDKALEMFNKITGNYSDASNVNVISQDVKNKLEEIFNEKGEE